MARTSRGRTLWAAGLVLLAGGTAAGTVAVTSSPSAAPPPPRPVESYGRVLPAGVQALVRIPALGARWRYPVYEGTGAAQLARGLAHYTGTAAAGGRGNFALAGHRSSVTGFEPFADLPDAVAPGTRILVETASASYAYRVTATRHTTPGDDQVLDPDQGRGADPGRRLITLTTCTPRYGSTGRFIVFGELEPVRVRAAGPGE